MHFPGFGPLVSGPTALGSAYSTFAIEKRRFDHCKLNNRSLSEWRYDVEAILPDSPKIGRSPHLLQLKTKQNVS